MAYYYVTYMLLTLNTIDMECDVFLTNLIISIEIARQNMFLNTYECDNLFL